MSTGLLAWTRGLWLVDCLEAAVVCCWREGFGVVVEGWIAVIGGVVVVVAFATFFSQSVYGD